MRAVRVLGAGLGFPVGIVATLRFHPQPPTLQNTKPTSVAPSYGVAQACLAPVRCGSVAWRETRRKSKHGAEGAGAEAPEAPELVTKRVQQKLATASRSFQQAAQDYRYTEEDYQMQKKNTRFT